MLWARKLTEPDVVPFHRHEVPGWIRPSRSGCLPAPDDGPASLGAFQTTATAKQPHGDSGISCHFLSRCGDWGTLRKSPVFTANQKAGPFFIKADGFLSVFRRDRDDHARAVVQLHEHEISSSRMIGRGALVVATPADDRRSLASPLKLMMPLLLLVAVFTLVEAGHVRAVLLDVAVGAAMPMTALRTG